MGLEATSLASPELAGAARRCKVLIVGSGPAGSATALYLLKLRPELNGQVIALEKRRHPRVKVCAGGLIPKTIEALDELGLQLKPPSVAVMRGRAVTDVGTFEHVREQPLCTVVRRDEFDHWLAQTAQNRGLRLYQNTNVLQVALGAHGVSVTTERGPFFADVLVGADGSSSAVRKALFGTSKSTVGRALTADLPVDARGSEEFARQLYRFDFRCVSWGIKGYAWSFPCLIASQPHLNVGVYDQAPHATTGAGVPKLRLDQALCRSFPELELDRCRTSAPVFKGAPIRWYDADGPFARGRVLLVGDAAGVDPMMGEGISVAFEHGKLAARAIARLLDGDQQAAAEYDRALHVEPIGRKLSRLACLAHHFYGPRHRLFLRAAAASRPAREIGLDWYNGVGRLDELRAPRVVAEWLRRLLSGQSYERRR
jgi:geranylgeranyl reductase family protein